MEKEINEKIPDISTRKTKLNLEIVTSVTDIFKNFTQEQYDFFVHLLDRYFQDKIDPTIFLITGEAGAGKTFFCENYAKF